MARQLFEEAIVKCSENFIGVQAEFSPNHWLETPLYLVVKNKVFVQT